MKKNMNRLPKRVSLLVLSLIISPSLAMAASFSPINYEMGYGSGGAEVAKLQTFLAANTSIYPEGLVTGYFGSLTVKAVKAFQALYGISQVGRVGPITIAKINSLIMNGWGNGVSDNGSLQAPMFTSVHQDVGRNSITFTWSTDEVASAKIYFDRDYIKMNWGNIDSTGIIPLSGSVVSGDGVLRTSQSLTVNNLMPGTTYHYTIVATDANGNVSVWGPNNAVTTAN